MAQYRERLALYLRLRRTNRLALVCCFALCGCTPALLAPGERRLVCQVEIEDKSDAPIFHANPLSGSAGVLVGAGQGAGAGLSVGGWPGLIIGVPIGFVIGTIGGTVCAAASSSHPDAEANFEKILHSADAGSLRRALKAELRAPRAECAVAQVGIPAVAAPVAVVEIQSMDVRMACVVGQQEYGLAVKWRVTTAESGKVLSDTTTTCNQTSFKDVDDWFADQDQARIEIERVMAKTGQRMAAELLASAALSKCKFSSSKTGEIEDR